MAQFELLVGVYKISYFRVFRFVPCILWFAHRYEPRNTQKKTDKPEEELTIFQTEPLPHFLNALLELPFVVEYRPLICSVLDFPCFRRFN